MFMKTPIGLSNIGNTCFANSVLQCMMHTPEMVDFVGSSNKNPELTKKSDEKEMNSDTTILPKRAARLRRMASFVGFDNPTQYCCAYCGIKEIFDEMKNSFRDYILPMGMNDIIKKVFGEDVEIGTQQDAHEFLIMLLHSLEGSKCLNKSKKDDEDYCFEIHDKKKELNSIFEGSFSSNISCQKCRNNNKNHQKFQDINLEIKATFDECMRYYFSPEKLEGENKYECENCDKYTNAVKSIGLKDAPLNLIISFKRFDKFGDKIKSDLKYPAKFNLNDYISEPLSRRRISSGDKLYELYAVINHEGKNSHCGHYTSFIKSFNGKWYHCDDCRVCKIRNEAPVKNSAKAYILFYRLIDSCREAIGAPRKISTASTQIANIEEKKNTRKRKARKSKFNRKRRKIIESEESSQKSESQINESQEEQIEIVSCAMSEVSDLTSTSSKDSKPSEEDTYITINFIDNKAAH
ncbi:unnamed protein product [Moneuplotes crassus]|uniref:Ubiquitin carboxyl-terminal hydrolase n=1 Tax=Euplotes crassus TaxID=5936 RepID=A0AAD1U6G9_EUPCR|nr:unnamed protein product [Moneuplotes crassus]